MDLVIGTTFDIFTHIINSTLLFQLVLSYGWSVMAVCFSAVLFLVVTILFNPRLAYANANMKDEVPKWIKDRIKPLTDDQSQKWECVEFIGSTLLGYT